MRILIVDDEPLARARLVRLLADVSGAVVVGEAGDGVAAREAIAALAPDVVLLDIEMPELDGMALAETGELPPVIFTTAYAEHAVRAFGVEAVDYLLKPVAKERLEEALERVRRRPPAPIPLTARCGETVRVVDARAVARFTAKDKYTAFTVDGEELYLDESLKTLEERLERAGFLRVHRAELVDMNAAVALHTRASGLVLELSDGSLVPVSRRMAASVRRRLAR